MNAVVRVEVPTQLCHVSGVKLPRRRRAAYNTNARRLAEPWRKLMNAVEATVQNRRIEVPAPDNWPDGTKVMVDVTPVSTGNRHDDVGFMTEDEQSDDPDAIERWIAELEVLPGITMTPEEEADMLAWRKKEKDFNLEAARREMEKRIP